MDIREIIEQAGGAVALAERLGISKTAVYNWKIVPPLRVNEVAEITGLAPHEIRPDIFKEPSKVIGK